MDALKEEWDLKFMICLPLSNTIPIVEFWQT